MRKLFITQDIGPMSSIVDYFQSWEVVDANLTNEMPKAGILA